MGHAIWTALLTRLKTSSHDGCRPSAEAFLN
jgi:hypothetical protein